MWASTLRGGLLWLACVFLSCLLLQTSDHLGVTAYDLKDITESQCTLPTCENVLKSTQSSARCHTPDAGDARWRILVTSTPRSATTFMSQYLKDHGLLVRDDWGKPREDGIVSWMFAFQDAHGFYGPTESDGGRFSHVLHQVRDPLKGLTSMCTEPMFDHVALNKKGIYNKFLGRHINFTTSHETPSFPVRAALQFWVEWHSFLDEMKYPIIQVEKVDPRTVFKYADLESRYHDIEAKPARSNSRSHRSLLTWDELFTVSPYYAKRAWEMAHRYGYTYGEDVQFDDLTCLKSMPLCKDRKKFPMEDKLNSTPSPFCPHTTHPGDLLDPQYKLPVINATAGVYGLSGYVSAGCSEHQTSTGEWIGVLGVHRLLEENPLPPEGSIIPSETTQPQITTPPQTTTPQTTTTTTGTTTATTAATTAPFVSTTTVVEVVPSGGDTEEPVHNNNNHPHHVIPDPLKGIDELDEYGNDPHHEEQVPGLDSAVMVMIVSAFFLGILVSKYMQRNTNKLPKNTTGQGGTGKNGPGDLEKQSDDLSNEILNALSD